VSVPAGAEPICLVDGRVVPASEARISPLDRGFLFGDSVYEALKLLDGRLLFLDRHLTRLRRGLGAMRIAEPPGLEGAITRLVATANVRDGGFYLQVTRGVAPRRTHLPPAGAPPTLFAMVTPMGFAERPWEQPGLRAISRGDDRWQHCDIKTTALAATVLGKLAAVDASVDEVLFVGPDGTLREGGNTSLVVRDAAGLHTHPAGPAILPGVTRDLLFELGDELGLPIRERPPRLADRAGWSEALLCGTLTGVRGLVELDGKAIGDGAVGPATRALAERFDAHEHMEAGRP